MPFDIRFKLARYRLGIGNSVISFTRTWVNRGSAGNNVIDIEFNGAVPDTVTEEGFTIKIAAPSGDDQTYTAIDADQYAVSVVDTNYLRFTLSGGIVNDIQAGHLFQVSHDGTQPGIATFTDQATLTNSSTVNLFDGLVAVYDCDETSGTLIDIFSSHDMTDNNTVGSATGSDSTADGARDYVKSNSEYHNVADHADFDGGAHCFIIAMDFNLSSLSWGGLAQKRGNSGDRTFGLYHEGGATDRIKMFMWNDSDSSYTLTADTAGLLSTGTWYDIIAWWDDTVPEMNLAINGTLETATSTSGDLKDSTADVEIGNYASNYGDFKADRIHIWNKRSTILSAAERTSWRTGHNIYPFKPY
jgi:hypothetical protein